MLKKLILLFSVLVLAFAVVACGDDEEEPASGGTETTQTEDPATDTEEATEAPTEEATEEDTGGTDVTDDPAVQQAIESCKSTIQAQTQLSDDLKGELEEICDKAGSGDIQEAQEASVEICVKIAEEMVPEGSARDQVVQQCESAAP